MNSLKSPIISLVLFAVFVSHLPFAAATAQTAAPDLLDDYNESPSRLRGVIEKFDEDYGSLDRFYTAPTSAARRKRLREFYAENLAFAEKLDFARLNPDEQIDYLLFRNHLRRETKELDRRAAQFAETVALLPFAQTISDLEDARRRLEPIDAAKTAAVLNDLNKQIAAAQNKLVRRDQKDAEFIKRTTANRAAQTIASLRATLRNWFAFYNNYDPLFTWWTTEPYKTADGALQNYQNFLLDKLVGIKPDNKTTIIGDPIGRAALLEELEAEMIPYAPEELIEIANREFAWCETEMKKAARAAGFGDDWRRALEAVKNKYVAPGEQPALIRRQAFEAIEFLEKNDLVTVPRIARDSWRMEMMSPERQLVAPFFLGGETILVSYPTSGMTHEQKLMSMRGNNPHFTRAVTHHELIPGHHLQRFMNRRYRAYRSVFSTPFWTEGWALYWEFLLWDLNFSRTPDDKIGALFWRMHRAARIIFSLNFHLEKMSPTEAVDFLVTRVGHERENALGEVRRSFSGDYGALYQIAYMIGGLQFYDLHRETVGAKKMTNREFHDRILREGAIPVELVRAILTRQKLTKDFKPRWRFYGALRQ